MTFQRSYHLLLGEIIYQAKREESLLFVLLSSELRERNFVCLTVNAVPC